MSTKPKWAEDGSRIVIASPTRDCLKVWLQAIYELEGETFYSVWMQGKCGTAYLRNSRGQAAAFTLDIAKRKAAAMMKHSVYRARTIGRVTAFEVCPKCNTLQKVIVDPENGVLVCSICEHPFFIPEPSAF